MTIFLTLCMICLICEGIDRTEISVRCCMVNCDKTTTWTLIYWLTACFFTRSWHPYVCEKDMELFEQTAGSDEVKIGEKREEE